MLFTPLWAIDIPCFVFLKFHDCASVSIVRYNRTRTRQTSDHSRDAARLPHVGTTEEKANMSGRIAGSARFARHKPTPCSPYPATWILRPPYRFETFREIRLLSYRLCNVAYLPLPPSRRSRREAANNAYGPSEYSSKTRLTGLHRERLCIRLAHLLR